MSSDQPSPPADRVERVLARELTQRGILRRPGETVLLRPDQIARLEPDGYFMPHKPARKEGST